MEINSMSSSFPTGGGIDGLLATRLGSEIDAGLIADLDKNSKSEDAAEKLEGLFATMLVKEMRSALSGGFFGEGSAGDIYGGWFDEHVGKALARDGALNLAGMIKANLYAKTTAAAEPAEDVR